MCCMELYLEMGIGLVHEQNLKERTKFSDMNGVLQRKRWDEQRESFKEKRMKRKKNEWNERKKQKLTVIFFMDR